MNISYIKNEKVIATSASNDDLEIFEVNNSNRYTIKIKTKENIKLIDASISVDTAPSKQDLYFLNGYQSWTDTKEFSLNEKEKNIYHSPRFVINKFAMDKYGDATFYKYSNRKLHGYDIFYAKGKNELFIYNMNYKNAYLIIELLKNKKTINLVSDVKGLLLKKDEEFVVFDYFFFNDYKKGLDSFNKTFPIKNLEKIFGYTSWYNYYQDINEEIILRDLNALDKRFNLFQIDDGFETFVGDWLDIDKKKFPNGLKPIVDEIHKHGYKAGIWLAPFAVEEKSETYKNHKPWLKKDKSGNLVKCGGNWSGFYALDLDNDEAVNYIRKCLTYYMELGFDFFKLDFLYASALFEYDSRTRCMVQDKAYSLLRDILKDKIILGCGANIINSIDKFDYLRVGPDVSLEFDDVWFMRFFHRERISTKNTLQNTIYRSFFNDHLFGNDPDVFLLRDDNIKLNYEQRIALTTINALFGHVLMTSDNIANYKENEKKILDEALNLFTNAKVLEFKRKKKYIEIIYELNDVKTQLTYDTKKGVFINGR
ncbi:MAG: alpha-galactosidase [Erysipelotrichales bacterium]|nr:alpha-galactosidase [Erysipelotrichales bacterium]